MKPIGTFLCDESKYRPPVERTVYQMDLTRQNIQKLWEKCSQFPILFSEPISDFEDFINIFLGYDISGFVPKGLIWVIDDFVGVYYLTNIIAETDALVHYSFFDRRHKGRDLMTLRMLQYGFNTFGFQRLTVEIPLYAKDVSFDFIRSLGFIAEGRRRYCAKYKDSWCDKKLFGVLRDECLGLEQPLKIEHVAKVS